jgi:hypothetical protein
MLLSFDGFVEWIFSQDPSRIHISIQLHVLKGCSLPHVRSTLDMEALPMTFQMSPYNTLEQHENWNGMWTTSCQKNYSGFLSSML